MFSKDFEQTLRAISMAPSPVEAFDVLRKVANWYGYDSCVFSLVTDHPSIGRSKQHGFVSSYPEDWIKYYMENNYLAIDPVAVHAANSVLPAFWDVLCDDTVFSKTAISVLTQGEEAGLVDGLVIPIRSKFDEVSAVGMARKQRSGEKNYKDLSEISLISNYFAETYRHFYSTPSLECPLTSKEMDVLRFAAEGMMDERIASVTGVTHSTIRNRWNRIFRKLCVKTRTQAVVKCLKNNIAPV